MESVEVSEESLEFAKAKLRELYDVDPEAQQHLLKACAPSISILTSLFEGFGLIDKETDKNHIMAILSTAMISSIDITMPHILEYLSIDKEIDGDAN